MQIRLLAAVAAAATLMTTGAMAEQAAEAPSGAYEAEETHRYITFSYLHQGYSRPWLRWRDWDATLNWDADNPANSTVTATITASSIDSGVDVFDGHLKGDKFFDVENHPEITFVSTSLEKSDDMTGVMTGDLTIKGVTKPVTLDVSFNKGAYDARKKVHKLGFSAKGSVNRSDFDLGLYVPAVGDQVDIVIEAEFQKPAGE